MSTTPTSMTDAERLDHMCVEGLCYRAEAHFHRAAVEALLAAREREAAERGAREVRERVEALCKSFEGTAAYLRSKHATSEAAVAMDAANEFRRAARTAGGEPE